MSIETKEEFRPKIVAFCCNWCSYAGADLAGSSRLSYPADVKIIRVPCSCRVNPMFILRAFEKGADGVIMCGCHPGDCHYSTGNYYARRRMTLLFSMLDYIGVENGRIFLIIIVFVIYGVLFGLEDEILKIGEMKDFPLVWIFSSFLAVALFAFSFWVSLYFYKKKEF